MAGICPYQSILLSVRHMKKSSKGKGCRYPRILPEGETWKLNLTLSSLWSFRRSRKLASSGCYHLRKLWLWLLLLSLTCVGVDCFLLSVEGKLVFCGKDLISWYVLISSFFFCFFPSRIYSLWFGFWLSYGFLRVKFGLRLHLKPEAWGTTDCSITDLHFVLVSHAECQRVYWLELIYMHSLGEFMDF